MNRIIATAALAVVILGLVRWLGLRHSRVPAEPHDPTENWENEGGAVSSPAWTQSSQAQR